MKLVLVFLISATFFNHIDTDQPNDDDIAGPNSEVVGGQCTADEIIDKMLDWFTPGDYEEGKANIKYEISSLNETQQALQRLEQYSKNVTEKMSEFSKRLNARMSEAMMEVDLSPECLSSLARIGSAIQNGELWAMKFLDAQPRPNNGLVELSGLPMGNYDQCLSIESPDEPNQPKIRGQYCGTTLDPLRAIFSADPKPEDYPAWAFEKTFKQPGLARNLMSNMLSNLHPISERRTHEEWLIGIAFLESNTYDPKLLNGLCIPSTCSVQEVSRVLNKMTYPLTRFPSKLHEDCDYEGKPVQMNKLHIITLTGVALMVTIFLVSSAIDCLDEKTIIRMALKGSSLEFIIECFSLKRNAKLVFSVAQDGKFRSMDGLRAILTYYVVLLHTYELGLIFVFNKNHYLGASYKMLEDYRNMFLPNLLLMDTFFIISAFLLGNTMISRMETSRGRFNWFHYILFRYFRLLPIILVGLAITFIFELVGSGPAYNVVMEYATKPCYDKWHKPILMYNNHEYYRHENSTVLSSIQCLQVSWYSSCDFQLYILAPVSFWALYKYPKHGLTWNICLLVLSVGLPVFNRVVLGIPHLYEILNQTNVKLGMIGWEIHYWSPINYLQTYIIGILVAFAVRRYPKLYLGGRIGEAFIWTATISTTLTLMYWQRNFMAPGYPFDWMGGYEMPVYLLVHKLMYLSGFAWLIYACETGRGGWLYKALSWKVFKFFDNVTVEIYIIHIFTVIYRIGTKREQVTYTDYYVWTSATFDYFASYTIAVCVALVVTKPFFHITQALLKKDKARQVKSDTVTKNTAVNMESNITAYLDEKDIKSLDIINVSNDKVILAK